MDPALGFRLTALLWALAATAAAAELPAPPTGFSWHPVDAIKASFLTPDGWHLREERNGKTLALYITEQDSAPPQEFEVGATITAFLDDPDAPLKLKKLLDELAAKNSVQLKPAANGPFRILACQYDSKRPRDSLPIRTNVLGIANPNTGTSYLITFESPLSRWPEAWAKGKPIFDNLALEPAR
ncbi:MAG: hypothetical protein ACHQ6T_17735 [Myxococcota bacterium]